MKCNIWKRVLWVMTFSLFAFTTLAEAVVTSSGNQLDIAAKINLISPNDQEILKTFFHILIRNGFGYTLFGKRPMCSEDYSLICVAHSHSLMNTTAMELRGWKVWEKYQHHFPMSRFIFKYWDEGSSFGIKLICKAPCLQIITTYQRQFGEAMGLPKGTPEEILTEIADFRSAASAIPSPYYHFCFGLLFGYAESDVRTFQRESVLSETLAMLPIETERLEHTPGLSHIDSLVADATGLVAQSNALNKYRHCEKLCQHKNPLTPLRPIPYVTFEANPDVTARAKEYDSVVAQITELIYSENFLEQLLTILTQDDQEELATL